MLGTQRELATHFTHEAAMAALAAQMQAAEELAMGATDDFLSNPDSDEDAFCRAFLEHRQAYHQASGVHERLRTMAPTP